MWNQGLPGIVGKWEREDSKSIKGKFSLGMTAWEKDIYYRQLLQKKAMAIFHQVEKYKQQRGQHQEINMKRSYAIWKRQDTAGELWLSQTATALLLNRKS